MILGGMVQIETAYYLTEIHVFEGLCFVIFMFSFKIPKP